MCGIAGIVKRPGRSVDPADRQAVADMIATMHHRGPDAHGVWEAPDGSCILGHARLSIIDIVGSPQPMPAGDDAISYNGEVYNFQELRARLIGRGVGFHTTGDTEVVLQALRADGGAAVDDFDGMFAFGFWSKWDERLTLARDPFGIKPLYYAVTADAIAFASELTSLRCVPGVDSAIADDALVEYLLYGYVPSPKTIIRGALKVPPGHRVVYDRRVDRVVVERYWRASYAIDERLREEEALELLDDALERAVGSHMVSEVALGAFLSGGIDSSLVVSYMARSGSHRAFTATFSEAMFDESAYAEAVARHVGVDLVKCGVSIEEGLRHIEQLGRIYDEPFSDSSALPTYLVCQSMRRHVTVALSGDGGDETFGGYLRYQRGLARSLRSPGSEFQRRIARSLREVVPMGTFAWRRLNQRALSSAEYYQRLQQVFAEEHLHGLLRDSDRLGPDVRTSLVAERVESEGGEDFLNGMQLSDIQTYLPEDCLTKVDRASMAHSLEVRVPLLSKPVWEIARRLPRSLRVQEGRGKVLLRQLARRRLPEEVVTLPKKGFSIPGATWFRGELMERFGELMSSSTIIAEYCSRSSLERLMQEHRSGARNHHHRLWNLMMLAQWEAEHGGVTSAKRATVNASASDVIAGTSGPR
jgi:asparagine synthase (glutamine-hydrolysing)